MAEPETITLPKSGLVLWRRDVPREVWTQSDDHDTGPFRFAVARDMSDDIPWRASLVVVGSIGSWQDHSWGKTRDECLAWLDARVLELRAALLPPGAIGVRDSEETVERVARAIHAENVAACDGVTEWEDACESVRQFAKCHGTTAQAVIQATERAR